MIVKYLSVVFPDVDPECQEILYRVLDPNGYGVVSLYEFHNIIKPLASFIATDVNSTNELETNQVKTLLWLCEKEEPSEKRVEHDVLMIDEDGSGTVDKGEWINYYLASSNSEVYIHYIYIYI